MAIEMCGQVRTVDEVIAIVLRDRHYYADSGGGLTLSGGEPLLQPDFTRALLGAAKAHGLHTAVETSGFAPWKHIDAIRPVTDLFLFDIKETDPGLHRTFTGIPLEPITHNLRRLAATGAEIVLRLPLIPGFNDRPDHISAVAALARSLPTLPKADLLPYHRLGKGKRTLLGQEDRDVSHPPTSADIETWKAQFSQAGLPVRRPEER